MKISKSVSKGALIAIVMLKNPKLSISKINAPLKPHENLLPFNHLLMIT